MNENKKIFSLKTARKMVPLLRSISESIITTWKEIVAIRGEKKDFTPDEKTELNRLIDNINTYIAEAESLGVYVHEFRRGIFSIPTLRNGTKVFLSWYPEDTTIEYWQNLDEQFSDRKLINARDMEWFYNDGC